MKKQKYREQYCKIHDQHYADFLSRCPICRGEEMGKKQAKNDLFSEQKYKNKEVDK